MHLRVFFAPLACVFLAPYAYAADVTPTAAPFLEIDASPRSAALAGSAFALPGGVQSTQWNPAGLSELSAPYAGLMHGSWFEGLSLEWASYATDLGPTSGAAVSATFLRSEALPRYDEFGAADGEFHVYDAAISAGYGRAFGESFAAGAAIKGIRQSVDNTSATGFATDLGFLWKMRDVRLAAAAQNLGAKMTFEGEKAPLPTSYALGAAAPFFQNRLWVSGAAVFPVNYFDDVRLGAEFAPVDAVAVRLGYRYVLSDGTDDQLTGLSYGVGFRMSQVVVDYAYRPYSDLGDTHRIGLTLAIGGSGRGATTEAPPRATPRKPEGDRTGKERAAATKPVAQEPVPEKPAQEPAAPQTLASPPQATEPAPAANATTEAKVEAPPAAPAPTETKPAPAATPNERFAVVAGAHRSRLSALIELRSLRESGLSGGEITRIEDGRYRVVLRYFDSQEAAEDWVQKASGEFGGQAFRVVAMP